MVRNIKLQIMWACAILIAVLILGYLGIFAIQKSMTIKMSFLVSPNVRCALYVTPDSGTEKLIFSNYQESYIDSDWTINEGTSTLTYLHNVESNLGNHYTMRVLNYTTTKVFVEVSGEGATYSSVALDAYSTNPDNNDNILTISAVSSNYSINFYKVENYSLTATLTSAEFDLTNQQSNLLKCGNNYYIPLGQNLNAKITTSYTNASIAITSLQINSATPTYTFTNNILTIQNANLTNNITLSASGVYYLTTNFTNVSVDTSYASNTVIQNSGNYAVTAGTNLQAKLISSTANYHAEISSLTIGSGSNIVSSLNMDYSSNQCVFSVSSSQITANISITAISVGDHYTVTFDNNDGTGGTTSVITTYGSPMPAITPPTKTDYNFNGYFYGNSTNHSYSTSGWIGDGHWRHRVNFGRDDDVFAEGVKVSLTCILNALPPVLEYNDQGLNNSEYTHYYLNGKYIINANVTLTSVMANYNYNVNRYYDFFDLEFSGTTTAQTIVVKNASYGAYCYYDFNAHSTMNCDLTANTTLTAKWVAVTP